MFAQQWHTVSVGVESINEACTLWVDQFGFSIAEESAGPDEALARLWGIAPDVIKRQVVLSSGGSTHGRLHLVEFAHATDSVRRGANAFDHCPKNLDIYVDDMPKRVAALKKAGYTFRNDNYSEVTAPDGTRFREIHLPSHDDINVVLLEVIGKDLPFTEKGVHGIGPLICIVSDEQRERDFYALLGFELLSDNRLDGPEIEHMIGLPRGAALTVSIWGMSASPLGEMEIIRYAGTDGNDLFSRARPPARGVLELHLDVVDLPALQQALKGAGYEAQQFQLEPCLPGQGHALRFSSPAGLTLTVWSSS